MSARTRVTQDPLQEEAAALSRKASGIELDGVVKTYPGGIRAVDDVSMNIAPGEFVVLVGPSGCGKSTLLRMIAGLEQVDGGCIRIAGRDVTSIPSRQRDIAMVFQDYALYPHMNVRDNLAFGLKLRRTPKPEIRRRVDSVARTLGLQQLFARRPGALSGGQRQRVAIGRAMVREPAAFLMDEPLSNLDAKLRVAMRGELARLHERLGITTVFVTHDQVEAMTLGQRVAVLRDGVIQQVDRPQELFLRPANLFVAAFIGSPSMNLVEAKVVRGSAYFAKHVVSLPDRYADVPDGSNVILGMRPTDLMHACDAPSDHSRLRVTADLVEEQGAETYVLFSVDAPAVSAEAVRAAADVEQPDDDRLLVDDRARFTVKLDSRRQVVSGDALELAVDSERMHLFDPETGATVDQLWRGDTSTSKPRSSV